MVLLELLDSVVRPLDKHDAPHRQESAPVKKILKGDATWATRKVILGWTIDTITMTIQLLAHQVLRLFEILDLIAPTKRRTVVNTWQTLLGALHSMVLAITGGKGLFSVL
jgi:hypothetical protein